MNDLDQLAEQLRQGFAKRPGEAADWRDPRAMPAALDRLRGAFGERLAERSGPRTNRALLAFRMAPRDVSFVDLKLACRAIARPADWEQRRLIDDDHLFDQLLAGVDALHGQPRHQQACLRALRAALLELQGGDHPLTGNERHLHDWLSTNWVTRHAP